MSSKPLSKVQQQIVERVLRGESKAYIADRLKISRQAVYQNLRLPHVIETLAALKQSTEVAVERSQLANAAKIQEIQTRRLTYEERLVLVTESTLDLLQNILCSEDIKVADKLKAVVVLQSQCEATRKANESVKRQEGKVPKENIHLPRSMVIVDPENGQELDISKLSEDELDRLYRVYMKPFELERKIEFLTETDPTKRYLMSLSDEELTEVYLEKLAEEI